MPDDVHPQIQAVLDRMETLGLPKVQDLDEKGARELFEQMAAARREAYPPPEVAEVKNTSTGAGYGHVPVRIYRASGDAAAPAIVFYHGGGHVIGSLDTHDTATRFMAKACACTVVSVDYRMGPEYPFPAAVHDSYDAARWVADNAEQLRIDPKRLVVSGDSAGGNLAAVVAIMARNRAEFEVAAQVLIYPVVDYRGGTSSYDRYGVGYGVLETETVNWFKARYILDTDQFDDWRASPAKAPSLSGLPPCLVITAECDVLHDEGAAYAEQLQEAGVQAQHLDYKGMTHGFFGYLGLVDDAEAAHHAVAGFLSKLWSGQRSDA